MQKISTAAEAMLSVILMCWYITVALRKSEKSASSEKVREKARGALFKVEDRDQPQNRPKTAKRGLYT